MNYKTSVLLNILSVLVLLLLIGCKNSFYSISSAKVEKADRSSSILSNANYSDKEVNEIVCDSLFGKKGYKIVLSKFANNEDEDINNAVFTFYKVINKQSIPIYSDSIFYKNFEIQFEDFNNDNVKEILIQKTSSSRSNLSYYLYVTNLEKDTLNKICGFDNILNPVPLENGIIIGSAAVSGKDCTSFYEIQGDSVYDFGITIYDDHSENSTYDDDFQKGILKIANLRMKSDK